jgi:hypothetical protein
MKMYYRIAIAALCLVSVAFPASGDVIFDNYGPGNGIGNGQLPVNSTFFRAFAFTPTGNSFTLSGIDLALIHYAGFGPNTGVVQLRSDAIDRAGAILEEWDLTNLPEVTNNTLFSAPPVSLISVLHPALTQGVTYWLTAGASDPSSNDSWLTPPDGSSDLNASFSSDGGITFEAESLHSPVAFRVTGSLAGDPGGSPATPEPGSFALLAGLCVTGAGCVFSHRKRRRK